MKQAAAALIILGALVILVPAAVALIQYLHYVSIGSPPGEAGVPVAIWTLTAMVCLVPGLAILCAGIFWYLAVRSLDRNRLGAANTQQPSED
jgi:hypothetical protein